MAELLVLVESNTTGTGRLFAERARDLGLVPHLLSTDPARYPYLAELAVATTRCRTGSVPAVVAGCRELARRHRVAGVTSSSDYFVAAAAAAAAALGRPGENPAILAAARDKSVQRRCFAARGVTSPPSRRVVSTQGAHDAAARLGPPVVVKPATRSGSVGVRRCDTPAAAAEHARVLLTTTEDERGNPLPAAVLVEAYVPGQEYSVELLGGEVRAVTAKHLDESRGFLEIGHDVPAELDPPAGDRLHATALAAAGALGLRTGPAHVELRVAGGEVFVVEVNARLAGGMIPQAIRAATGEDLVTEVVASTAGLPAPPPGPGARPGHAAVRFLVPDRDGVVRTVPDPAAALGLPGVVDVAVTARPGRYVAREGSFLDRFGHVVATGRTGPEAGERADRALAAVPILIDPHDGERP